MIFVIYGQLSNIISTVTGTEQLTQRCILHLPFLNDNVLTLTQNLSSNLAIHK